MSSLTSHALTAVGGALLAAATVLLAACRASPVTGRPFDPAAPMFPAVSGESLNNRRFSIPADLDAPFNILLVAFYQRQQAEVDTWIAAARQIAADHANVEYYELPTIASTWGTMKWWVDGGMRSGIPEFGARERTVTLYTDTAKFRSLAGIDDPTKIWTGLVDRQGKVYWSARGPATDEMLTQLRQVVRDVASPAAK